MENEVVTHQCSRKEEKKCEVKRTELFLDLRVVQGGLQASAQEQIEEKKRTLDLRQEH